MLDVVEASDQSPDRDLSFILIEWDRAEQAGLMKTATYGWTAASTSTSPSAGSAGPQNPLQAQQMLPPHTSAG